MEASQRLLEKIEDVDLVIESDFTGQTRITVGRATIEALQRDATVALQSARETLATLTIDVEDREALKQAFWAAEEAKRAADVLYRLAGEVTGEAAT